MTRKLAEQLRAGDIIRCKGNGWYRVETVELEGSSVYATGSSDLCDDDMPMMLQRRQLVELE